MLETYPRDELFQAAVPGPDPHRARRGQPLRAPHGAPAGAPRPLPPLLFLPRVRAARPLQHRGARAHRGDRARGLRRHRRREPGADLRLEPRARARRGAHRPGAAPASRTSRRSSGASPKPPSPGRTACARCWSSGCGEARGLLSSSRYQHAFPLAYEEDVAPAEVLEDLDDLEALREQPRALRLNLYRPPGQVLQRVHLKIVKLGDPVPISDVLPMLENFGLRVISERPYELSLARGRRRLDPGLRTRTARAPHHRDRRASRSIFRDAFARGLERRGRERRLQPPAARRRTQCAPGGDAARLLPLPAADRRAVQPGLHGAHARGQRRIARDLVRLFETRFDPAAHKQRGNDRKAVSIVHPDPHRARCGHEPR